MVERWNSPRDSSSRYPNIGFQRRQESTESSPSFCLFPSFFPKPFSQLLVLSLSFSISNPPPLFITQFSANSPPHSSLSAILSPSYPSEVDSPLRESLLPIRTQTVGRCVSARVPKNERISRNERLLTVGKNYLNWNWSFHRPSRRLLHAASSYPPSCRSIPSKSE